MNPPTVSYKHIFNSVNIVSFLFWPSPFFSCSLSFQIVSLCHHLPFHICFSFPPFFLFCPSLLHPHYLHFLCIHQVNLSLFPQCIKSQRDTVVYSEIYYFHCCMLTYISLLLFYKFWSESPWSLWNTDFIWLQVKTSSKATLKLLCKRSSSVHLPDYCVLENCEKD